MAVKNEKSSFLRYSKVESAFPWGERRDMLAAGWAFPRPWFHQKNLKLLKKGFALVNTNLAGFDVRRSNRKVSKGGGYILNAFL
jgi:hypothetical protein